MKLLSINFPGWNPINTENINNTQISLRYRIEKENESSLNSGMKDPIKVVRYTVTDRLSHEASVVSKQIDILGMKN